MHPFAHRWAHANAVYRKQKPSQDVTGLCRGRGFPYPGWNALPPLPVRSDILPQAPSE